MQLYLVTSYILNKLKLWPATKGNWTITFKLHKLKSFNSLKWLQAGHTGCLNAVLLSRLCVFSPCLWHMQTLNCSGMLVWCGCDRLRVDYRSTFAENCTCVAVGKGKTTNHQIQHPCLTGAWRAWVLCTQCCRSNLFKWTPSWVWCQHENGHHVNMVYRRHLWVSVQLIIHAWPHRWHGWWNGAPYVRSSSTFCH